MNRSHYRADGRPKMSFATRAGAKEFRERAIERHGDDPGQPYRCPDCDSFHLGHYPTNERIRRRMRARHHPNPKETT
jgi:hypothetical protein